MERKVKFGLIIVAIYITLVIAALIFILTVKSEFAGVYIIVLTIPWSFAIFESLGNHANSMALFVSLSIGCAIVNALVLYWFGNKLNKNL